MPRVGESLLLTLGGKVNIKAAGERDFRAALGVSVEIAQRMVACRRAHGPSCAAVSRLLFALISPTTYGRARLPGAV
jgi:hypothetical protein